MSSNPPLSKESERLLSAIKILEQSKDKEEWINYSEIRQKTTDLKEQERSKALKELLRKDLIKTTNEPGMKYKTK